MTDFFEILGDFISAVLNAAIGDKDAAIFAGVRNDQNTMNHTKAPENNVQATLGSKYNLKGNAQLKRKPNSKPPKMYFRDNSFRSL